VQASLDRSSALDVAYVLVGKQTTPAAVSRGLLKGDDCDKVTHFVRAASVGAYAVATATKGSGAVAANVFGAAAHAAAASGKNTSTKAGDPDACNSSKGDDANPPNNCGSPFRLELSPVKEGGAAASTTATAASAAPPKQEETDSKSIPDPCPEGFKLMAGKCAVVAAAVAATAAPTHHLCAPEDKDDCEKQCAAGDPGSCFNLASQTYYTVGGGMTDEQRARVVELEKKACDGGIASGCSDYATICHSADKNPCSDADALKALNKACDLGGSDGCEFLGQAYFNIGDTFGLKQDYATGTKFYTRSCNLGDASGCRSVAQIYFSDKYGARDPAAGDKLLSQFCAQGDENTCLDLGRSLLGLGISTNKYGPETPVKEIADALVRGRASLAKACELGQPVACLVYFRTLAGAGDADARKTLVDKCPDDTQASEECGCLGASLFDGKGGAADKKRGLDLMGRSSDRELALRAAQILKNGDGVKKNEKRGKEILDRLCDKERYTPACQAR
jgi:TPR repeat protein